MLETYYRWWQRHWPPRLIERGPMLVKLKALAAKARTFLKTPAGRRVEHVAAVFVTAFAVTAYGNRDHLLAAHGLDGLKSAGYSLAVATAYAAFAKVRPLLVADAAAAVTRLGSHSAGDAGPVAAAQPPTQSPPPPTP